MSRHRNIRNQRYRDDFEHNYDDVYGHSVEEEGCISPTSAGFMFQRSQHERSLSSFMIDEKAEDENKEEEEDDLKDSKDFQRPQLNQKDQERLHHCLEEIRNVIGDTVPELVLVEMVVQYGFNLERALDAILSQNDSPRVHLSQTTAQPPLWTHQAPKGGAGPGAAEALLQVVSGQPIKNGVVMGGVRRASDIGNLVVGGRQSLELAGAAEAKGRRASADVSGARRATAHLNISTAGKQPITLQLPPIKGRKTPSPDPDGSISGGDYTDNTAATSSKKKKSAIDVATEYAKRQEGKDLLNLVVIGHVDAGKSTLMGHVLYQLGNVNQKTMHKYEKESKKAGKASFAYAWVLDETGEERERGITMDVGLTKFETDRKVVTLLDAPGHRDFIPNMITGAAQADVAVLVVNATRGEFETGFELGGQTREHALLVRSLGVAQLVVAVNKLDMVDWDPQRYQDIVTKLGHFLKQARFKESDIAYVPCSGLLGENLAQRAKEPKLLAWYKGTCLVEEIDAFRQPKRPIDKPFRMCVSDVFKGMGAGFSLDGKIESGSVQPSDRILAMPAAEQGTVKAVSIHDEDSKLAFAGDHITLTVTGMDQMNVSVGTVICSVENPIKSTTKLRARVLVFNVEVPITKGFPVVFHYQTLSEPAIIKKLISVQNKDSSGEKTQKKPRCLVKGSNAEVELELSRPVCVELYEDNKDLGRFMLRSVSSTIAAGVVTQIL